MKQVQLCSPQKNELIILFKQKLTNCVIWHYRQIIVRYFVNKAPGFTQNIDGHG